MENQLNVIKSNLVGAIAGGYVGYWVVGKSGTPSMTHKVIAVAIGILAGANLSKVVCAKLSAPTASTVKG